jgi:predicted MFS family arabinose efflux permease
MGVTGGPLNPILMTVRQERVPAELRGRVFGTFGAIAYLAIPAGMLVGGVMISALGEARTLVVMGSLYMVLTVTMVWNRALNGMERTIAGRH